MATILVVDDSAMDRRLAVSLLEEDFETVTAASNGAEALAIIAESPPDLVVTDIQMPEVDGFQLVADLHRHHPEIPVILMTAFGSEDLAVKSLQLGASSYVPKDRLLQELAETVHNVLAVSMSPEPDADQLASLVDAECKFVLQPMLRDLDHVIAYIQDDLRRLGICDEADLIRVSTALHEAIVNATEHGNLEVSSEIREQEAERFRDLVKQRCRQLPYCQRRVEVSARLTRDEACFVIRDEGPGFDPSNLPDPRDPENVGKASGRGIFLIRTFMDEVSFNATGNEITMIKRRPGPESD